MIIMFMFVLCLGICFTVINAEDLYLCIRLLFFFFFSSRRRHTRFDCDWSSDVCSSDLALTPAPRAPSITAVRRICRLSLVFAGSREGLTAARVPGRRGHEVRGRRLGDRKSVV